MTADFNITDFATLSELQREQAAAVLNSALLGISPAYRELSLAFEEVKCAAGDSDRVAFAALRGGRVIGWIGAIRSYGGHAWELHPLVVDPASQRQGVGRALVSALEQHAAAQGATTLFLGTDDEFGGTNLFGRDPYPGAPGPLEKNCKPLQSIRSRSICVWGFS